MNKDTINKYKLEFNHWLNGGNLLRKLGRSKDGWRMCDASSEGFFNTNDVYWNYVIDDEYAEYRKAIAENKVVMYTTSDLATLPLHLCNKDIQQFKGELGNYSIEPDEPKFEVGDWVRHIQPYDEVLPWRVELSDKADEFEFWVPKPDEWCWFWDSDTSSTPIVGQLKSTEGRYITEGAVIWEFCQPFIGELPEHLKEVKCWPLLDGE